jgi:hypothetical protein
MNQKRIDLTRLNCNRSAAPIRQAAECPKMEKKVRMLAIQFDEESCFEQAIRFRTRNRVRRAFPGGI